MKNRLTKGALVVVASLALWAVPSIARAHAGNNDPTLLHVCIGNISRVVRSVGVGGSCIAGPPVVAETADHWPKATISGPKGDKGDKGDSGTNGTNGMDGTSVSFVGHFSGNQNGCPNGGATYAVGNPPVQTYVCNGLNGTGGTGGTRADLPCFDNTNRYVDCGNGTVTDTVTGLIWLRDAACLGLADYAAANGAAAAVANGQCGLTDGSSPGDWRLPTKDEWSKTILNPGALGNLSCTEFGGKPPSLTNDAGTACYGTGLESSFVGVAADGYWSSSTNDFGAGPLAVWYVNLLVGAVSNAPKVSSLRVWPVRGGAR